MVRRNEQRGVALVIVLWFIALLTILALGFSREMRTDARITANLIDAMRARHFAEAAIERGIAGLLNEESLVQRTAISGRPVEFELGEAQLSFVVQDENGKININQADVLLIENLLLTQGIDQLQARAIADAIEDWRDENDLRQLNGAELAEYREANMGRMPANAPFQSVAELQQVIGITPSIFNRLAPLVTVYGSEDRINPLFAPPGALRAIPGIDSGELEDYLAARESVSDEGSPPALPELTGVESWVSQEEGPIYTVHGKALLPSGAGADRRQIVWRPEAGSNNAFHVLEAGEEYLRSISGAEEE